jgi:hypothetical protein
MHVSIRRFAGDPGDPDDLLRRYDAMTADMTALQMHLCLRAPVGIVIVDACPSREVFEAFAGGNASGALRRRHGLPDPANLENFPLHAAFIDGRAADVATG